MMKLSQDIVARRTHSFDSHEGQLEMRMLLTEPHSPVKIVTERLQDRLIQLSHVSQAESDHEWKNVEQKSVFMGIKKKYTIVVKMAVFVLWLALGLPVAFLGSLLFGTLNIVNDKDASMVLRLALIAALTAVSPFFTLAAYFSGFYLILSF